MDALGLVLPPALGGTNTASELKIVNLPATNVTLNANISSNTGEYVDVDIDTINVSNIGILYSRRINSETSVNYFTYVLYSSVSDRFNTLKLINRGSNTTFSLIYLDNIANDQGYRLSRVFRINDNRLQIACNAYRRGNLINNSERYNIPMQPAFFILFY